MVTPTGRPRALPSSVRKSVAIDVADGWRAVPASCSPTKAPSANWAPLAGDQNARQGAPHASEDCSLAYQCILVYHVDTAVRECQSTWCMEVICKDVAHFVAAIAIGITQCGETVAATHIGLAEAL